MGTTRRLKELAAERKQECDDLREAAVAAQHPEEKKAKREAAKQLDQDAKDVLRAADCLDSKEGC